MATDNRCPACGGRGSIHWHPTWDNGYRICTACDGHGVVPDALRSPTTNDLITLSVGGDEESNMHELHTAPATPHQEKSGEPEAHPDTSYQQGSSVTPMDDAGSTLDLISRKAAIEFAKQHGFLSTEDIRALPAAQDGPRSFPDAADGRPMPPMGDELMTAGLNGDDARFVAIQLAQNGLTLAPAAHPAQRVRALDQWGVRELARSAGISPSTASRVKSGIGVFDSETMQAVRYATGRCMCCGHYALEPDAQDGMADALRAQVEDTPQAWLDVIAERHRQVSAEGWTPEHDDDHDQGELAAAAATYALVAAECHVAPHWNTWPWQTMWWKPTTPRRDLVKAGALILAEIERLDRVALPLPNADKGEV